MADLNVQPKKRSPVWPWILVALIIAAVVFFVVRNKDTGMNTSTGTYDTTDTVNTMRTDTATP